MQTMVNSSASQKFQRSVTVNDIDCACVVGLDEGEQVRAQPLKIDISMDCHTGNTWAGSIGASTTR